MFFAGPQRGGSTFLRALVNAHPALSLPRHTEIDIAARLMARTGPHRYPSTQRYVRALHRSRRFQQHGNVADPARAFPDLVRSLLAQSRQRAAEQVVGATVHQDFAQLLRIWPDARFVYLQRDPRAVALSALKRGWAGNYFTAATQWLRCWRQWQALRERVPPEDLLLIAYEDLVADRDGVMARVFEHLGVRPATAAELDAAGRPDAERAGAFLARLHPHDIVLVEARVGAALEEAGYRPLTAPRTRLRPWAPTVLAADEKLAQLRLDRRRVGITLLTAQALTRPLHPGAHEDLADAAMMRRRAYGADRHRRAYASLVSPPGRPTWLVTTT